MTYVFTPEMRMSTRFSCAEIVSPHSDSTVLSRGGPVRRRLPLIPYRGKLIHGQLVNIALGYVDRFTVHVSDRTVRGDDVASL